MTLDFRFLKVTLTDTKKRSKGAIAIMDNSGTVEDGVVGSVVAGPGVGGGVAVNIIGLEIVSVCVSLHSLAAPVKL